MLYGYLYAVILIVCCGWVLNCVNKLPSDVGAVVDAYRCGDRQKFWLDLCLFLFFWTVSVLLVLFIVYPMVMSIYKRWEGFL